MPKSKLRVVSSLLKPKFLLGEIPDAVLIRAKPMCMIGTARRYLILVFCVLTSLQAQMMTSQPQLYHPYHETFICCLGF